IWATLRGHVWDLELKRRDNFAAILLRIARLASRPYWLALRRGLYRVKQKAVGSRPDARRLCGTSRCGVCIPPALLGKPSPVSCLETAPREAIPFHSAYAAEGHSEFSDPLALHCLRIPERRAARGHHRGHAGTDLRTHHDARRQERPPA